MPSFPERLVTVVDDLQIVFHIGLKQRHLHELDVDVVVVNQQNRATFWKCHK